MLWALGITATERAHERLDAALAFEAERAAQRWDIEALPPEPPREQTEFVSGETDWEYWAAIAADRKEDDRCKA